MGHRKTQIIATVYGKPSESEMLTKLAESKKLSKTELIKKLIKKEYKSTLGGEG